MARNTPYVIIKIPKGTTVPSATDLFDGELGFRSGTNELYIRDGATIRQLTGLAGTGDLLGPSTNTDNYVPQWNGADSKTLKNGLPVGGANGLVQLNGSGQLPALDASLLTNIPVPASAVVGPITNSDNYIPQWNGANSKTLKNGLALVTTIGSPGVNTSVPTEAAVRSALNALSPTKTLVHNWSIDGSPSTGELPAMNVRAPFTIKNIHMFCGGGLTPSASVVFSRKDWPSGSYTATGTTLSLSASNTLVSQTINVVVTGTSLYAIMPNITSVGGTVTDLTISVEIEY